MSTWIFVLGLILFYVGIMKRATRIDETIGELANLEDERKLTRFWGEKTEDIDRQINETNVKNRNWKSTFSVWIWWVAGAAICAISIEVWLMEDTTRSMDQLWDHASKIGSFFVAGGLGLWWVYQLLYRLDRMERNISWQNKMLSALKDHAENMRKGSITNFVELKERLDTLQGLR